MPRFFVLSGPGAGRSFDLGDGAVIGRGAECEAVLADASVSRRHARLVREDGRWTLVDLDSRNGLRVRGRRAARAKLVDGDVVELGKLALRVRIDATEGAGPEVASASGAPSRAPAAEWRSRPQARSASSDARVPALADDSASLAATRELRRAAVISELSERKGGVLGGELEQRPFVQRLALALLVLALAAGVAYAAFRAVQFLRAG